MVTGEGAFVEPRRMVEYVIFATPFPRSRLEAVSASPECCEFIERMMASRPQQRPTAKSASGLAWILLVATETDEIIEATDAAEIQRYSEPALTLPKCWQ